MSCLGLRHPWSRGASRTLRLARPPLACGATRPHTDPGCRCALTLFSPLVAQGAVVKMTRHQKRKIDEIHVEEVSARHGATLAARGKQVPRTWPMHCMRWSPDLSLAPPLSVQALCRQQSRPGRPLTLAPGLL